jgi:DNA-binding MarR family transcriptional regulator
MKTIHPHQLADCNCLAFRQAARQVTQHYDRYMAKLGLRTTQFTILAHVRELGPVGINALAERLVMDRTTLGRNILPLEREGLIAIGRGREDRRSKALTLTDSGLARLRAGIKAWAQAQGAFEARFGRQRLAALRGELRAIAAET